MMKMMNRFSSSGSGAGQKGQTFIPIMVFIAMFLLAMLGVAVDYSQLWAHRQIAQAAADAACQAGSADIYINAIAPSLAGTGNGLGSFSWIGGSAFNCTAGSTLPPCQYAALNGFGGANASNVNVSFPTSVTGVDLDAFNLNVPAFIKVTITDNVPMTLSRIALDNPSVAIKASATCGVAGFLQPVPLVILHPTADGALSVTGNAEIIIIGGAQRSIQVNSSSQTAVNVSNNKNNISIDLSAGGPSGLGSDVAVLGGPIARPLGVDIGQKGHYISPSSPVGDPFTAVPTPTPPANNGTARPVPFRINGCPDTNGCVEFTAGNYTGCTATGNISPGDQGCLLLPYTGKNPGFTSAAPDWQKNQAFTKGALILPTKNNGGNFIFLATNPGTTAGAGPANWPQFVCTPQADGTCSGANTTVLDGGITWLNVGVVVLNKLQTGIFDPGLYFVGDNGLSLGSGSTARLSTADGDNSKGVMFYFNKTDSVKVAADSGNAAPCTTTASSGQKNPCVVSYLISGALSSPGTGYLPSVALQCPSGTSAPVPDTLDGNILLGPCGKLPPTPDPGISPTYGSNDGNRGFLFFQNRSQGATPSWGGGGGFLSSGFMYFTSGGSSTLTLQGNSGSQSFTLGNIVVDKLALGGTPQIKMILNPTATFEVLKPTLLQ
jgi:hypothetical protein